ncbi:MAG: alpha/beta hydrolase [Bacteroidota bacterium]
MKKHIFKLLICSLLILLCSFSYTQPTRASLTAKDGADIHYTVYGEGKKCLVFLHGWICDQSYWKEQIEPFSKTYQVVLIDLAGHGKSSKGNREKWTIPSFAEDVEAVIDKLEYEDLYLVGHSMGAMVAIETAVRLGKSPTQLIAVDYLKDTVKAVPLEFVKQSMQPFEANFAASTKAFVGFMFTEGAKEELKQWILDDMSSSPSDVGISAATDLASRDFTKTMDKLRDKGIPSYLINTDMRPTNKAYFEERGFKLAVLPNSHHFFMMEKPEEFNTQLKLFLQEH